MKEQHLKFTEFAECPSKLMKKPMEPISTAQQTKYFNAGGCVDGVFKDDPHTAWESYQKTMATDQYRTIMVGDLYPKRYDRDL